MSTDSQGYTNVSSNIGKSSLQVKSTTNFIASKKVLGSQTFQIHPNTMNNSISQQNGQSPVYQTKVNNFMKQFSNQPSSKFNTSSKAVYDKKSTKQTTTMNTLQDDNSKCKDELKEYKKLQEKLSYLESKIMNIKTNIDSNNQKQAEQQLQLEKSQYPQQNNDIQPTYGLSQTQHLSSYALSQPTSQFSSIIQTGRIIDSKQNLQDVEAEKGQEMNTQSSLDIPSSQIINVYTQTITDNRNSDKSTVTPMTCTERDSEAELKQIPQQQPQQVKQSPLQQTQKGGLGNFITQVNQGANVPFSFTKSKGETNSTKSSTAQLQTIKPSSTQHSLKKQNTISTSVNKSIQNSSVKTPKQQQILSQQPSSTTNSNSNQYKSFAFKPGQNSYSQQHQASKNASVQNIQSSVGTQNSITQNDENEQPESQVNRQSIQTMKNSTVQNQLNGQISPYIKPKQQKLYYVSSIIQGYQNIGDNSTLQVLAREHLISTMQSIQFTKYIQVPSLEQIESKRVFFNPLKEHKKTLIFDLDETLIHCNENINIPSDIIIPIVFPTGEVIEAGINIRPYAVQILEELSKIYEIVIFTASHSCYANVVLDHLDPQNKEHCVQTEDGVYVKDLRVIANRNMSEMIIVDNAAYSFGFQVDNGLPIIPFYDNKEDQELKYLITYMKSIQYVRDFREVNKKLLKIGQYSDFMDPQELIEMLYPDLINV